MHWYSPNVIMGGNPCQQYKGIKALAKPLELLKLLPNQQLEIQVR